MRIVAGVILLLHGLAHLPGFVVAWRLGAVKALPYKTTLFGGRLDVGDAGMRIAGAMWLAATLAFVAVAVAAFAGASFWPAAALRVALASLVLCTTAWPEARIGAAVNAALATAALWMLA